MAETMPPLVQLTGPLVLGHLFTWGLFGALTVQVYLFYISFPKDPLLHKCIVLFVYLLEITQIVLSTRDAFSDYGSGWGNLNNLEKLGWMWFSIPIMSAIIGLTAQLFYAWRIWVLSARKFSIPVIPIIVVALSLTQFTAAVYAGVHAHELGSWSQVQEHLFSVSAIWLVGSASCDIVIACSMTYCLYWSQTGFKQTNVLLMRLIRLTVETGAICALLSSLDLVLFIKFKYNNFHLPACMALAELYGNSLVMVLNSRRHILGGRNETTAQSSSTQILDSAISIEAPPLSPRSRHSSRRFAMAQRGTPTLKLSSVSLATTTSADSKGHTEPKSPRFLDV